ncbi:hypothetical protein ACQKKG_07455 [Brevundimonas sp. NPDC003935]|uniref:hypothetical protein n=1 Tax=unclassified Brevundimonas TaxID=2622653 RepID=UPI00289C05D3|nr:hypothetical protein [Brevundimonas sp.]
MHNLIGELRGFVDRQLWAEESGRMDWLAANDEALGWIGRLDEQGLEVSPAVFLFLEETLHRRDPHFGLLRREQMRKALTDGTAFPA